MWFAYLLQGIGYGFSAALQPGPFQTYVISQALSQGWRESLPAALAPLVSDAPVVLLAVLVLSQVPDWMRSGLYVASGIFILYLAASAFKAWRDFDAETLAGSGTRQQGLLRAALVNLLSPGPYIYWSLVAGPILLAGWRQAPADGVAFLVGFYASMIGSLAGLILLFGHARRAGPRITRGLIGVSAIILAGFGLYQLWLGLASLSAA